MVLPFEHLKTLRQKNFLYILLPALIASFSIAIAAQNDDRLVLFTLVLSLFFLFFASLLQFVSFERTLLFAFFLVASGQFVTRIYSPGYTFLRVPFEFFLIPVLLIYNISTKIYERKLYWRKSPLGIPLLLYALSIILSMPMIKSTILYLYSIFVVTCAFIFYSFLMNLKEEQKKKLKILGLAYLILVTFITLAHFKIFIYTWKTMSFSISNPLFITTRFGGKFTGPNSLAAFSVASIFLLLSLPKYEFRVLSVLKYANILLLFIFALFTFSRNAYITLLVGALLYAFLYSLKTGRFKYFMGILAAVLALIFVFFLVFKVIILRLLTIAAYAKDYSVLQRFMMWKNSLIKIGEIFPLGIGYFNFFTEPFSFHQYTGPHNLYIQITLELGLLGLVALISLIFTIFTRLVKIYFTSSSKDMVRGSLFLIILWSVFFIHNMFDNVWTVANHPQQMLFLAFYLAYTNTLILWYEQTKRSTL